MNTIIIITGDLATGKTSYGKKISNELKIPFFSKDEIKEVLYDSFSNNDLDYESKRKIGKNSYDIFYYIIEQQLRVGLPIIAESNFGKEAIPVIKNLLDKYNYKSITIRFEADLEVLHKRFLNREYSDERHAGLVSNGMFDDYENFKKTHEKSREFKIDDNEILIDTTEFKTVDINSVIKQLQEQMK